MSGHLKILPLLIFVAMLAFSVRLTEVVVGVRDISGAAHAAADSAPAAPATAANEPSDAALSDAASGQTQPPAGEPATTNDAPAEDTLAAAQSQSQAEEPATAPAPAANDAASTAKWRDAATDTDGEISDVKMEMFQDLAARRKDIEQREQTIVTREALLRAAEQELDRKYQEMEALRLQIEQLLKDQSDEEKKRIESLVKIYEGMKPKEAARIFDTLDLDVLVNVVSQMSERKLSPILASMEPERARTVTIMLAEQKKLPELPN